MADDEMVKEQLTEGMIEAGAAVTSKLDELGLPVTASLWFLVPDLNEWRLLLASKEVSTLGPRAVYEKVRQALEALGPKAAAIPLSIVSVLGADADLVQILRGAIGTGPAVAPIRFSKNTIQGHYIEDALIYRAA